MSDDPTAEDAMTLDDLLARPPVPPDGVSPHTIQRLVAGAVAPGDVGDLRRRIEADPDASRRLRELLAEERAFEAAHPWEAVKDELFARAEALPEADEEGVLRGFGPEPVAPAPSPRPAWWRGLFPAAVGVAAAILAFAVWTPEPTQISGPNRVKSADGLTAFALVEGHTQPLAAGEALGAGDRIQLQVSTPHRFLAVLGVDGTGTVSRYFPVGGEQSGAWEPGAARPLPDSFVLDDAPGPEVFVAFLSDDPLPLDDLQEALHDRADAGPRALLEADFASVAPQVDLFYVEKTPAP